MTPDQRSRLYRLLLHLEAEDLAVQLGHVADVMELPDGVRSDIADVLGNEAALHGYDRFGRPNRYNDELDELVDALGVEAAQRGVDANGQPTAYGRELNALIDALGLDE